MHTTFRDANCQLQWDQTAKSPKNRGTDVDDFSAPPRLPHSLAAWVQMFQLSTYSYIPIHTYSYLFIPIHTYSYLFIPIHTYSYLFIPIHTYSYLFIPIHTYSTLKSLEMPWRHISKLGFSRRSGYGDFWMGEWSKVFGPPWIIEYDRDLIMIVTVVTCRATCRVVVSPCAVLSGPPPPPPPLPAPVGIAGKAPVIAGLGAMPPVLLVQLIPRCSNLFRGVPRSSINQDSHNQTEINKHKIHGGKQMSWCHIEIIKTYI